MPDKGVIADARRITTQKTRIIARHQQVVRVDREQRAPLTSSLEQTLISRIKAALPRLDALVVSDYGKGVVTEALADRVLDECRRLNLPALVKPKESRLFAYRGATTIVCNSKEAGFFVGHELPDQKSVEEAGRALLAHFGCAAVIITQGRDGMSLFEDSASRVLHVPSQRASSTSATRAWVYRVWSARPPVARFSTLPAREIRSLQCWRWLWHRALRFRRPWPLQTSPRGWLSESWAPPA